MKDVIVAGLKIIAIVSFVWAFRNTYISFLSESGGSIVDLAEMFRFHSLGGVLMLVAVVLVVRRLPRACTRQYAAVFVATILAAACIVALQPFYGCWRWPQDCVGGALLVDVGWLSFYFVPETAMHAAVGMLIAGAWLFSRANAERARTLERVALDSARLEEQSAQARLQVLEAQIEPHFLFNTLAHVKRLYDVDPANGERMLRNLKAYLSIALPQMRDAETTLGREAAHVVTYLEIQQIRMGRRLAFDVAVPPELARARVPPLMLLTLAENAIKHGIAPTRRGGRVDISAQAINGRLRLDVSDTGQGFTQSKGGGTGLANIRARLRAQFGDAASLSLRRNSPAGIVATLELPLEPATDSTRRP